LKCDRRDNLQVQSYEEELLESFSHILQTDQNKNLKKIILISYHFKMITCESLNHHHLLSLLVRSAYTRKLDKLWDQFEWKCTHV